MRGEITDRPLAVFVRVCTRHHQVVREDPLRDRMECPAGHGVVDGKDTFAVVRVPERPGPTPYGTVTGMCVDCAELVPGADGVMVPVTREGRCFYCGSSSVLDPRLAARSRRSRA